MVGLLHPEEEKVCDSKGKVEILGPNSQVWNKNAEDRRRGAGLTQRTATPSGRMQSCKRVETYVLPSKYGRKWLKTFRLLGFNR